MAGQQELPGGGQVGVPSATPGPWQFDDSGEYMTYDVIRRHGMLVARPLTYSTQPIGEYRANARLIAAAPELRDLVRSLVYDVHQDDDVDRIVYTGGTQKLATARALLARLDGQEGS